MVENQIKYDPFFYIIIDFKLYSEMSLKYPKIFIFLNIGKHD
uniref:Uncharacterized protein n=1 Tax=Promethearchaeum syntrophicum TaxID=2594042 RepID=A0A5B9D9Q5_9ARCH|nr:hypothetical protein DSAG12_01659 [Candidatus Prometheoarchaeum syntrophicum]